MKTLLNSPCFNQMYRTIYISALLGTLTACGGGGSAGVGSNTPDPTGPVPDTTAPVLSITPTGTGQTINIGQSIDFTGSATDAVDGNISADILWSLDGASQTTGASWNATFSTVGNFTIAANVSDAANNAATAATYIVAVNSAGGGDGSSGSTSNNPQLNSTSAGFKDAVLTSTSPDCTTYATDSEPNWDNGLGVVDYDSHGMTDTSNAGAGAAFSSTDVSSYVRMDLVIASSWNENTWNYDNVIETTDISAATHCRMTSNMIPNHDYGLQVGFNTGTGWVNEIDQDDWQTTYIPVNASVSTNVNRPFDTPRNPTNYMDYDGIMLNGVGIAMDSGFCYYPYVTTGSAALLSNPAGNSSGCGPTQGWHELPAYNIYDPDELEMAANFDDFFAHGFVGTYHYHAITHPFTENDAQNNAPQDGSGNDIASPVIGYAPDGFPIFGRWFEDDSGNIIQAESGFVLINTGINIDGTGFGQTRAPGPFGNYGIPPTSADLANYNTPGWVGGSLSSDPSDINRDYRFAGHPSGIESFGLELGRYEWDWEWDSSGNTGNLDECNGRTDSGGNFVGYYVTDKYPFTTPCSWGDREPSFGKAPPFMHVGTGNGNEHPAGNEETAADQLINGRMPVPVNIN